MKSLLVSLALLGCASAFGAGNKAAQPAEKNELRFGDWVVEKHKDDFTDKLQCYASPVGNLNVWTTGDHMLVVSVKGRGGVKFVQSRIDDGEIESHQPSDFERSSSSARIWMNDEFMAGRRLRVQVLPLVGSGLVKEDFSLSGIVEADSYLNSGECKGGWQK